MALPIYNSVKTLLDSEREIDNLHLRLHKLNRAWQNDWNMPKDKSTILPNFTGYSNQEMNKIIGQKNDDLDKMVATLKTDGYYVADLKLTTKSRLLVGNGDMSALEFSLYLHFIFGFPFIPASSLKGMVKFFAEMNETGDSIQNVFGLEERETKREAICGKVNFLDVVPVTFPKLESGILTQHYNKYYQESLSPGEWFTPVPLSFITVAPGAAFRFILYSKEKELAQKAENWLKGSLSLIGIGTKTRIGYGRFNTPTKQENQSQPNQQNTPSLNTPDDTAQLEADYIEKNKALKIIQNVILYAKVIKQEGAVLTVEILHPDHTKEQRIKYNAPVQSKYIQVKVNAISKGVIQSVGFSKALP